MKHLNIITNILMASALSAALINCGGNNNNNNNNNTKTSYSTFDDDAVRNTPNSIAGNLADGTGVALTDSTIAIGGTAFNTAVALDAKGNSSTGGGIHFPIAFPSQDHLAFSVIDDGKKVHAFAAGDVALTAANAGVPGGPSITYNTLDYAYVQGSGGQGTTPVVSGTNGSITYDPNNQKFNGTLGAVQINGTINGQNLEGTATLGSATGDLEGFYTSGTAASNGLAPVAGGGAFSGSDGDDAFAGAYIH